MTGHLAFVKTYFEEAALPRASRCQSIEGWLRILLSAADSLSLDQGRQHRQTPVHSNRPRQARPDQSHTSWYRSLCWKFPEGPVIDVSSLDEGTLILRKELFDHFLHKDQPWKPVAIKLDYTANKVTGAMKYASGPDKPVSVDLSGPVFAYAAGP